MDRILFKIVQGEAKMHAKDVHITNVVMAGCIMQYGIL